MPKSYVGGCHCRRIKFTVTAELNGVTECNCSICRAKGYLHLIVPSDQFQLLSGADDLASYRFNTMVAEHKFCRTCGVHSFYVPRSDPDKIDVNVRCLDDIDLSLLDIHRFDGSNWEASMQGVVPWKEANQAPILVLATLTVKVEALASFEAYERTMLRIMSRHGGKLERAIRLPSNDGEATFDEIHLLSFPSFLALESYRADPERLAASAEREACIVKTTIFERCQAPDYAQ